MGSFSLWHWVIVALVVLVLFGRGRISEVMGDFGKGITSFKKGLNEADKEPEPKPVKQIEPPAPPPAAPPAPPPVSAETAAPPAERNDTP